MERFLNTFLEINLSHRMTLCKSTIDLCSYLFSSISSRSLFVLGITVSIKPLSKSKIRVFPIRKNDHQPKLRTNFTYDVKMAIPEKFRPKGKNEYRDFMNGYLGECSLRELRYFDVGRCFVFDTLHNLYRGTFVSTSGNVYSQKRRN